MKKQIKLVTALLLMSSVLPTAALAETSAQEKEKDMGMLSTGSNELPPLDLGEGYTDFRDAMGTIYAHAVWFLTDNGFAQGMTRTHFGVNEPIKRVDVAVILDKYLLFETRDVPKASFSDVPQRAQKAVDVMKHYGIVNGKSDTRFDSYSEITRGEAAIMLYNAHKDEFPAIDQLDEVHDFSDVSGRYQEAIQVLSAAGIIKGKNNGTFGTKEFLTRGQLALIIERIFAYNGPLGEKDRGEYASEDMGISMKTDKYAYYTYEKQELILVLENKTGSPFTYLSKFMLQMQVGEEWYEVPYSNDLVFDTGVNYIDGKSTVEMPFSLKREMYKGALQAGAYRIVQQFYDADGGNKAEVAVQFRIYE